MGMKIKRVSLLLVIAMLMCAMAVTVSAAKHNCRRQGHVYGSWRTTVSATCKRNGQQQKTCKYCGAVKRRTIGKAAHKYGSLRKHYFNYYRNKKNWYWDRKCTVCGKWLGIAH